MSRRHPHRSRTGQKIRLLRDGVKNAADLIGDVGRGERVCGVTSGQFSLLDLIHHLINQSGPADVVVSTWTAGFRDIELAKRTERKGNILSMIWIVDRSFLSRQPAYAAKLVDLYGNEAIRVTRTHAKFVIIDGPDRRYTVQSSMNLNQNRRMESFDITEGDDITDHYLRLVEDILATATPGLTDSAGAREVLNTVMRTGQSGDDGEDDTKLRFEEIDLDFDLDFDL